MFNVTLLGSEELIVRLETMPVTVQTALLAKANNLAIKLRAHVQDDKLSGQVLKIKTGALRASINFVPAYVEGSGVYAKVIQSGDVKYGRFWEYGFHGIENVKAHTRTMLFGKSVDPFTVGPYVRKVDQDARPFMRPALADNAESISLGLKQAAVEALQARSA